jgi:hypothetical protein
LPFLRRAHQRSWRKVERSGIGIVEGNTEIEGSRVRGFEGSSEIPKYLTP